MIIFNKKDDGNQLDLFVYGDIQDEQWWESDVTANSIKNELTNFDGELVNVYINSFGGQVNTGLAIYNLLKRSNAKITTIVDGFACSAASLIFMAGHERIVNEASLIMIHQAWSYAAGTSNELVKAAETLEKIDDTIASIYLEHCSCEEEELKTMLKEETWLTADEAKELNFATAINKNGGEIQNVIKNKVMASFKGGEKVQVEKPTIQEEPAEQNNPPLEPEEEPESESEAVNKLMNIFGKLKF